MSEIVHSVDVYECEFETIPVDGKMDKRKVGLFNAEMTRDWCLYGTLERALLGKIEGIYEHE